MLIQTDFRPATDPAHADSFVVSALLAQARPCAVTFYEENSAIYAQGDRAGPLYLVEFGAVRLCRLTADGRRQISAFHFAGEIFGFEFDAEHHHYAESVDGVGVRVLRRSIDDHLAESLLPLALRNLSRAQDHLLVLGRQNATEKVAAFLLDLAERQDAEGCICLPMQRNDIADYLGLTFETVSRILRKLKDSRIIQLPTIKQVEVLDLPALARLCG